jgi:meso-butanediol dehydrogenase/(S,S)-butanediol dehydrogenase/diacetyl reductase
LKLEGKIALITGGGTGIGAEIARRFTDEGAKVCITGIEQEMLDEVAASLPRETVLTFEGDVSNPRDVKGMLSTALQFNGKLDILVNNAGIGIAGNVVTTTLDDWQKIIDVNLTGPFLLMKESIPFMQKTGGGSIVNISSVAGLRSAPDRTGYCVSKAALIMLTQQTAMEFGPYNIRCNVICPGATRTKQLEMGIDMMRKSLNVDFDTALATFTSNTPLRRVATPGEIASVCCFLAGDDSSFMTGAVLVADGGSVVVDASFGAGVKK